MYLKCITFNNNLSQPIYLQTQTSPNPNNYNNIDEPISLT